MNTGKKETKKGTSGHWRDGRKLECPVCKIHHENSLDSCLKQDKLKKHQAAMAKKYGGGQKTQRGGRPFQGNKDKEKVDVDPTEKIDGMLSAAALITREKK